MEEENVYVLEWSIENFSCWNNEIHGKGIISPESEMYFLNIELFPRGVNGQREHIEVCIRWKVNAWSGDICFIGSDGSILCTLQVELGMKNGVLKLVGPKFEDVVANIRKNEALHRDQFTLRLRLKSERRIGEYIHTVIDACHVSFIIDHKILENLETFAKDYLWLTYPLDEEERGRLILAASKTQKMILSLAQKQFKKKVSVFIRVTVLNNEEEVRIEEGEHLFCNGNSWSWSFLNSQTSKVVGQEEFSLKLYIKIISKSKLRHSVGFYGCNTYFHFQAPSLIPSNEFRPSGTSDSKAHISKIISNVLSNQSDNSLKNLSKDFTCLYQDQDFSDLQLKCGDITFPVHRAILSARSHVFKTMLSTDMREAASNEVDITDLDPSTLGFFLTYLYTGTLEELQGESALKLYYAADKYEVPSLKKECADFLCENASVSNVCDILSLADKHQDDQLIAVAHDFFLENFNEVLRSEEWKSFMKSEPLLAVETVTHFGDKNYVTIRKAP